MVEQNNFSALADGFVVTETLTLARNRAAVHTDPKAIRTACRVRGAIVEVPDFKTAGVTPLNPAAVSRVVPIMSRRERLARVLTESSGAVFAVADAAAAQAAPTVIGEAFGMITFG